MSSKKIHFQLPKQFPGPKNGWFNSCCDQFCAFVPPCSTNHHQGPLGIQILGGLRSTACKTWTASWVNPWVGMVRAPGDVCLQRAGKIKKNPWFIVISPWLFRLWVNYYSWEIMVNYISTILRYAIPHFWRKFYMKYPSGTRMVDKRDPVYQPRDDSACDTAKVESHIDQRPIDPVDIDVIGNYGDYNHQ